MWQKMSFLIYQLILKTQMNLLLFVLLLFVGYSWSANILGFFPTFSRSSHDTFQPLLKELAVRGHNVTVVSHFPLNGPPTNYHHIDISTNEKKHDFSILPYAKYLNPLIIPIKNLFIAPQIVLQTLNNTKVKEFIHSDGYQFDVVLFDNFYQHSFVAIGHKFGAHVIQLLPTTPDAFFSQLHNQPFNPSFTPDPNSGYTDQMSLFMRIINFLVTFIQLLLYPIFYMPKQNEIMYKHFNYTGWESRPPIENMIKNISLTLINTHFTIGSARPFIPNFIEVAGMHLKPVSNLPKFLQDFMDDASNGVVYFSFGSVFKATQLPKYQVEMFIRQLGQIKQKVLWEWESDDLPSLPSNVIVDKWFPQMDILGHHNCVLFITYGGGIYSTEEAIYFGVPMLAISVFGDQLFNSIMMESRGAAIRIKYADLTEHIFDYNLKKMLNDTSFKNNAIKLSKMFHDQPLKPLDKAVYWIEYVICHNGAHHLKPAGNQLNWFQLMSIDVILILLSFSLIFIFVSFYIMEKIYKTYINSKESNIEINDDHHNKKD